MTSLSLAWLMFFGRFSDSGMCRFGDACSQAHGDAELAEWKERFEQRKQTITQKKQVESYPYADRLTEKIMNAENRASVVSKNKHFLSLDWSCNSWCFVHNRKCYGDYFVNLQEILSDLCRLLNFVEKLFTSITLTVIVYAHGMLVYWW